MRLLYVFIICVIAYVNVLAADPLPLDKDGFGGIKWGTEYSDKLGMKECIDYGSHITCVKTDEEVRELVGVPITVKYTFNAVYFSQVTFEFEGA